MGRNSKQLTKRLIELRNAIKRKYKAFKEGTEESDIMLEKQYKPIIQELRKTPFTSSDIIKSEQETMKTEQESVKDEAMDYDSEESLSSPLPPEASTPKAHELSDLVSTPSRLASTTQFIEEYFDNRITQDYMTLFIKDAAKRKVIDYSYGPRYEDGDVLMIGNKELNFDKEGNIIIGKTNYGSSEGLYELIFKRLPDKSEYNENDLKTYKSILIATNAHRKDYKYNGKIQANKSKKYTEIIKSLFPSQGSGMVWKTTKSHDIIHWDDANELVDRLKHIAMSTETGNRVHNNEILSIIEELREAGYIKGAGNSRFKALLQ